MYTIEEDKINKMIRLVLSECMGVSEIEALSKEINALLSQHKDKEYSMFAILERLDPISQAGVPYLIEVTRNILIHMNKIAVVHKRFVTQMQMRRVETEAKYNYEINNKIMMFHSSREALNYLKN